MSNRLTDLANQLAKVVASLASHFQFGLCGPVLERSKGLRDFVDVLEREGADPKMPVKIAELRAAVTDCLLKRGSVAIQCTILENPNARMSENGIARVIMGLDGDASLAQIARRLSCGPG